ncbi:MAG: ion transporter [Chitinophagales bacterium]|nr:ion transporter [Chitinophagales bacterium]
MYWRKKLYIIIFGTNTKAGKLFDLALLWVIIASVLLVMMESVAGLESEHGKIFHDLEWIFTILFTIEYLLRIYSHPKPLTYVFSFWGLIDLLSILPAYLSLVLAGTHFLTVIRILRLARVFRILKLGRYFSESQTLGKALYASSYKITVFLVAVLLVVITLGSVMYVVEGGNNGFSSIPQSIYWAIITITTVGYGDIVPVTALGKFFASLIMIIGYAIIAVPTGIITAEITKAQMGKPACPHCGKELPDGAIAFCPWCGEPVKKA